MSQPTTNGWSGYEKLVLDRLGSLQSDVKELRQNIQIVQTQEIGQLKVRVSMLEVRTGIIALVVGSIPATIVGLITLLSN